MGGSGLLNGGQLSSVGLDPSEGLQSRMFLTHSFPLPGCRKSSTEHGVCHSDWATVGFRLERALC